MDFDNNTSTLSNVSVLTSSTGIVTLDGSGAVSLPSGDSASRPNGPTAGQTRFNSQFKIIEYFDGVNWLRSTGGVAGATNSKTLASLYSGVTPGVTGTTVIPADTTTPLITEGTEIWSQTITPIQLDSTFLTTQNFIVDAGGNNKSVVIALFRNSACVDAITCTITNAGRVQALSIHFVDTPATTLPVTYSLRAGVATSGAWYINQDYAGSVTFGGVVNSSHWTILELI